MGLMDTEATVAGCFHHHIDTGSHVQTQAEERQQHRPPTPLHERWPSNVARAQWRHLCVLFLFLFFLMDELWTGPRGGFYRDESALTVDLWAVSPLDCSAGQALGNILAGCAVILLMLWVAFLLTFCYLPKQSSLFSFKRSVKWRGVGTGWLWYGKTDFRLLASRRLFKRRGQWPTYSHDFKGSLGGSFFFLTKADACKVSHLFIIKPFTASKNTTLKSLTLASWAWWVVPKAPPASSRDVTCFGRTALDWSPGVGWAAFPRNLSLLLCLTCLSASHRAAFSLPPAPPTCLTGTFLLFAQSSLFTTGKGSTKISLHLWRWECVCVCVCVCLDTRLSYLPICLPTTVSLSLRQKIQQEVVSFLWDPHGSWTQLLTLKTSLKFLMCLFS